MIHILDLQFQTAGTVAAFLIETGGGPLLVETGPHSTYPALVRGLAAHGYAPEQVGHVLLSHIHFDHAGAAWALARAGATIHVHPEGLRHLADPTRLYDSARRIYGELMEPLWGAMQPIAAERLAATPDGETLDLGGVRFRAWHTPGHAKHHIAWQTGDVLFTGDVAGVKIGGGPVCPPCPPPDIDLELWQASIERIVALDVERLYLTHFGEVREKDEHLGLLSERLVEWGEWIRAALARGESEGQMRPAFEEWVAGQLRAAGTDEEGCARYEAANPAWMSVAGLARYWGKRGEIG